MHMNDDRDGGGVLSMLLTFCEFVGALTILLTIWVLYVIKTRDPAPLRAAVDLSTPPRPIAAVATPRPHHIPEPILTRPDILRQRRVSFKTSSCPDRRHSSESESGSITGSSVESAPPETPVSSFISSPTVHTPTPVGILILDDTSPCDSPASSIAPSRRRFSGFKALRSGSRSRTSSPERSLDMTVSDGETSASGARPKSLARMVRSFGKRSRRTASEVEPSSPPMPATPPPSAFRTTSSSLVNRVMRRSSLKASPASPITPTSRAELYGQQPTILMPEARRSSSDRPSLVAANMDIRRVAGLGIERPSSAPLQRPKLVSAWSAPLDRHQRQARAADEFGVWPRNSNAAPLAPMPRRVSPLFNETRVGS